MNAENRMKWHHSIEKRLILIFIFAMTLTFGVMTSISIYAGLKAKQNTEEHQVSKSLSVALNLLGAQIDNLAYTAKDYGHWDDTYQFIDNPSREFIASSMDMDSLKTSELNALVVHNREGELLYRISTYDYITDSQLWLQFKDISQLAGGGVQRGAVFLKGRILTFVSQPVSDNSGSKPSNGRLTLLKEITQRTLDDISNTLGEEFNLINMLQPDTVKLIVFGERWEVRKSEYLYSDNYIEATYSLFLNEHLSLPLLAELKVERMKIPFSSLWSWLIPEVLLLVFLTLVLLMILRKTVTKPVKKLVEWLNQVDGSQLTEDLKAYEYAQHGEIGVLSEKFSEIYNNLYQQHQFSQMLLYSISDFIFTVDARGRIDYCNPAAAEWLKIDSKEVYHQDFELLFASVDEEAPSVANWLYRALETYSEFSGQVNIRKLSEPGKIYLLEVQVCPILYNDTEQKGAMIILRLQK